MTIVVSAKQKDIQGKKFENTSKEQATYPLFYELGFVM
jgi:hypothetical protein